MPKTKAEAAYDAAIQFNQKDHLELSGVLFNFSSVKKRANDILIGLRHSAGINEVYLVSIPLSEFERVKAIYSRTRGGSVKWSTSENTELIKEIFKTYQPAVHALRVALTRVAAAAPPVHRRESAPGALVFTETSIAPSEQTMSIDVRAPSERLVAAATQTLDRMQEEEEISEEDLDEAAEQVYGPVDVSQSRKDVAKAYNKRRKAAAKAFQVAMQRRHRTAAAADAAPAALIPRITASDVASTHALLYELATSLPQQEQAEVLREIADAGTDLTALTRVGKRLLDKRARLAQQRVEQAEARKPKTKSRKQVMKMVRKLRVTELDDAEASPAQRMLHLTSEQAERLRNQLNAAYDAASAGRSHQGRRSS